MYIAGKGKIPDSQWNHNPEIKNVNGETVAIILASTGIIPPE